MSIDSSMTRGFPHEIAVNFPEVADKEYATNYGDKRKYGTIYPIKHEDMWFCMCYMHTGGYQKKDGVFVDYESLRQCLHKVNEYFHGKTVFSPIMGCGIYDGNGDKEKIIRIFEEECKDIDLVLYDYEQRDFAKMCFDKIAELRFKRKNKEITSKEYYELRRQVEWKRLHGIFKEMPEDYEFKPIRKTQRQIIKITKNLVK